MPHSLNARRPRLSPSALLALDFGLRIRLEVHPEQAVIFCGAENLSLQQLSSQLAEMVSELRVRSFSVRGELERVTAALIVNAESGCWPLARRAALDLADLLRHASKRRLADAEHCVRGAHAADRIADLAAQEVR